MAEYISTVTQDVAAGSPVILQTTAIKGGCSIQHRDGTGSVSLRGSGSCCNPARYKVFAHVSITTVDATPVQLGLALDGEVLPETIMSMQTATVGTLLSGSTGAIVLSDFGSRVTIEAITAAEVNTALLTVERIA